MTSDQTLVERLSGDIAARIEEGSIRAGERLPSIRDQAQQRGVSRYTVVDAYDRLVATGHVESRRGSGFYVTSRARPALPSRNLRRDDQRVTASWLSWNHFSNVVTRVNMPGSALLPADWLDAGMLAASVRAVGRGSLQSMLHYGLPAGYMPLRQQLQLKLAQLEIDARPEQIVVTSGVTHAIDLLMRQLLQAGDTVLVDDPGWYRMFAMFAAQGVKVVGVPRLHDGPDVERLQSLAHRHRPRFYLLNSVLHNPTGATLSAAKAHAVLRIAEREDFRVVESDVFGDFHGGAVARLASLDQLRRVVYVGSFSKTLSATLRVGFVACSADLAEALAEQKIRMCLTGSELAERVVHRVLLDGHYRKHVARLRNRLATVREPAVRTLERIGMRLPAPALHGVLLWADTGIDTDRLALEGAKSGYVLAPGSLFTAEQRPSTWMRFNVVTSTGEAFLAFLQRYQALNRT